MLEWTNPPPEPPPPDEDFDDHVVPESFIHVEGCGKFIRAALGLEEFLARRKRKGMEIRNLGGWCKCLSGPIQKRDDRKAWWND